ncbi:glycosyltransferase 87 family protein [Nonomuraea purpurea]|uniref:Glycosyltransferase 87 family protein n=1 Tax=Nonomuraea purpurea TaxID=1849276 RepID=A0ABV8GCC8_9ACTN
MTRDSGKIRFLGWAATAGIAASVLLTILLGVLGPSAMVPTLPGPSWQPPFSLTTRPGGYLVIALGAAAIVLGGAGLAAGFAALARGWTFRADLWVGAGIAAVVVLAFLPPSGSADHLNYAAYGRLAVLGHDPYTVPPEQLGGDPVAGAVEEWRGVTSVYGPVATAVQALAAVVGGDSVRLIVFVLAAVNAAAYAVTGLLLFRSAAGDDARQRQVALLWAANPLMIYHLSAGMHVDTLAIACMVAALVCGAAGRHAASGLLLGIGVGVKATAGLVALGPAWELRRSPRSLAIVTACAVAVAGIAYAVAGPQVLNQVGAAGRRVSLAVPWSLMKRGLQHAFGPGAYTVWIQVGSLLLMAVLVVLLLRAFSRAQHRAPQAAEVAVAVVVAWLFSSAYALPWYDGLAFALLALAFQPGLAAFMTARVSVLSLAYLPARQAGQPPGAREWLVDGVRANIVPWLLLALTGALMWWAWRAGRGQGSARPGHR